jgi:hypothetical protein
MYNVRFSIENMKNTLEIAGYSFRKVFTISHGILRVYLYSFTMSSFEALTNMSAPNKLNQPDIQHKPYDQDR